MKPKIVHVDFNDSTLGTIAREGEHNSTQLVFALDEDLQACDFINIEFGIESSGEKLVLENFCPKEGDNTLKVSLTQDVTVSGVLYIQLVGYAIDSETSEPHMIAKSPVVSGVVTPSIKGVRKILDSNPNLLDRILTKVHELLKKAHTHKYSNTLDALRCPILEDPFTQMIDDHYLQFNGSALRFVSDGAVIRSVKPVEKNGKQFLRLNLFDGRALGPVVVFPDFVDIPVSSIVEKEEVWGNITLNGSELELPSGGGGGSSVTVDADGYIVIG